MKCLLFFNLFLANFEIVLQMDLFQRQDSSPSENNPQGFNHSPLSPFKEYYSPRKNGKQIQPQLNESESNSYLPSDEKQQNDQTNEAALVVPFKKRKNFLKLGENIKKTKSVEDTAEITTENPTRTVEKMGNNANCVDKIKERKPLMVDLNIPLSDSMEEDNNTANAYNDEALASMNGAENKKTPKKTLKNENKFKQTVKAKKGNEVANGEALIAQEMQALSIKETSTGREKQKISVEPKITQKVAEASSNHPSCLDDQKSIMQGIQCPKKSEENSSQLKPIMKKLETIVENPVSQHLSDFKSSKTSAIRLQAGSSRDYSPRNRHYHLHKTSSPSRSHRHRDSYQRSGDRHRRESSPNQHPRYDRPISPKGQFRHSSSDRNQKSSSGTRKSQSSSFDQYDHQQERQLQINKYRTKHEHSVKESTKSQRSQLYENREKSVDQKEKSSSGLYNPLQPSSPSEMPKAFNPTLQINQAVHGQPVFLPTAYIPHIPQGLQGQAAHLTQTFSQPAPAYLNTYPSRNPPIHPNFSQQADPLMSTKPSIHDQSRDPPEHHVIEVNANSGNCESEQLSAIHSDLFYPSKYSYLREPAQNNVIVIQPNSTLTDDNQQQMANKKYKPITDLILDQPQPNSTDSPNYLQQNPLNQKGNANNISHQTAVVVDNNAMHPATTSSKRIDQYGGLDEAVLTVFLAFKSINHPTAVDDFPQLWQLNGEQSANQILEFINQQKHSPNNTADYVIEQLRIVHNLIGKDVTMLDEMTNEMREFEQNLPKNLSNDTAATTIKEMKFVCVFIRLFRKTQMLLAERAYRGDNTYDPLVDWLCLLDNKIGTHLISMLQRAGFSNAAHWVINMANLENLIEIVDLAILLTLPNSMLKTFTNLAKPTMIRHLFDIINKNEFLEQFNLIWTNPWAQKNNIHLIRIKIGKNVSSKAIFQLGKIFSEQITKLQHQGPNQLKPAEYNRQLHKNVFLQLHWSLEMLEFKTISAPKLIEAKKNGIAYLDGCKDLINT